MLFYSEALLVGGAALVGYLIGKSVNAQEEETKQNNSVPVETKDSPNFNQEDFNSLFCPITQG